MTGVTKFGRVVLLYTSIVMAIPIQVWSITLAVAISCLLQAISCNNSLTFEKKINVT